jgi:hypothetical protein
MKKRSGKAEQVAKGMEMNSGRGSENAKKEPKVQPSCGPHRPVAAIGAVTATEHE